MEDEKDSADRLKIVPVVGACPNFMKIAPFMQAIEAHNRNGGQKSSMC